MERKSDEYLQIFHEPNVDSEHQGIPLLHKYDAFPLIQDPSKPKNLKERFYYRFLFGGMGGAISTSICFPLDLIRNNLASENDQKKAKIFSKIK